MAKDNCIFVGGKPFMNYVTGIVMQFTTKDAKEVIIKARGKFISRAVDIAEVTTKRFLKDKKHKTLVSWLHSMTIIIRMLSRKLKQFCIF